MKLNKNSYYAVIAAAGSGRRMGVKTSKQLLNIGGAPVLEYSVVAFLEHKDIDGVVLVVPHEADEIDEYKMIVSRAEKRSNRYGDVMIAYGGEKRGDSVYNGVTAALELCAQSDGDTDRAYVLIHDAARPWVDHDIIDRNIAALDSCDAVCTAIPSVDSVRIISDNVLNSQPVYPIIKSKSIDRRCIYSIQTPQSFRIMPLIEAYEHAAREGITATDDAGIAEACGLNVVIVEGKPENKKITTLGDLPMTTRVGSGFDVHPLVPDRDLILCGTSVPGSCGLLGHSDADVAAHAVIDALLGAAGKGDIGRHFPDTDAAYKDADSMKLLRETRKIIGDAKIGNIDITIIAEAPRLAPYIEKMRENIAAALDIPAALVNVKATTTEGIGFTGRREGIAAMATCTIEGRFNQ